MNKRSKRLMSLALASVMAVSLVAGSVGCSKNTETAGTATTPAPAASEAPAASAAPNASADKLQPEAGAKLKVWENEQEGGEWVKAMAKEFTDKYKIEITYEPVSHTESAPKLATDGPAKQAADVLSAAHDHLGNMASAGLVLPNDVSNPADFLEAAVTACSYDGKLYGYPTAIETYGMFYNKKLIPAAPKTYQEVVDFAKKFNDTKNKKYGFMMESANFYFMYSFFTGYGGYVFGKKGTDANDIGLNNDGSVEGAKFFQSLKEILPMNSADITYDIKESLFKEGKLAMQINGPWAIKGYKDAGVDFGVSPLPLLPNGKHPISFSGVRGMYVNSYTQYPNASKLLASFLTSKDAIFKRYKSLGQLPPRQDLVNDPEVKKDELSAAFLQQAQYAEPMPSIPQMGAVWAQMGNTLASIWNDKADVKKSLDDAVKQIKDTNATTTKK